MTTEKKLVLYDGQEFTGISCGADAPVVGELVFNTSMVGYQEVISDPAYAGQIVVMTYPLVGQYGITDEDFEARSGGISGLVVRELCDTPSNFRYTKTLGEELEERGVPCVSGVDTRMITRIIREGSVRRAAIVDADMPVEEALAMIAGSSDTRNRVAAVSCSKRWFSRTPHHNFDVVVVDCGLKHSIVSAFNRRGCNVTIVPFNTSAEDILAFSPDGVVISNGPGDPAELPGLVEMINKLKGALPIFGICLGQELIALSYGAGVSRMKCGHHGGHPVRCIETGRIMAVEHNHDFAVDEASLACTGLEITYKDVADGTVEGIECKADKVFAVQFYPEGCPGPEVSVLFDRFVAMMEE